MSNEEIIREYLNNEGLTKAGIAGLMGNLSVESGLRSDNLQNSYVAKLGLTDEEYTIAVDCGAYSREQFINDHAGYGLAQWTYWSRKQALYDYIKCSGKSIGDLTEQLDYLMIELSAKYPTVLNVLKTSNDVEECGRIVMLGFERPANQSEENIQRRIAVCRGYYKEDEAKVEKLRICIDAGHGLSTPGKRCLRLIDQKETREWVLNSRIADKLCERLENYECDVMRVDDTTGTNDIGLSDRVKVANSWKADVYISIHHNAGINGGSGGGTVVYYYSNNPDRAKQCQKLYEAVVANTKLVGNRSTKTKKYGYYVLANTKMPAFLIENGFMDSKADTPIILTEAHADKTVKGLLEWLISVWGLKAKAEAPQKPVEESSVIYKVQCGAFRNRDNAIVLRDKLKAEGYEAVIVSG